MDSRTDPGEDNSSRRTEPACEGGVSLPSAGADASGPLTAAQPSPAQPSSSRPPSPAELAASISAGEDTELDRAVADALQGVTEADVSGAAGAMAAVAAPSSEERKAGDIVTGRIANIGSEDVLIDFDGKCLGVMLLSEFDKSERPAIGDSIQVLIVGNDERSGLLSVSRQKAHRELLRRNMKVGLVVEARVTGMNKGGLEVDVEGLRGFIPASQVELHFMKDISDLLGKTIQAEVTRFEMDDDRENIVLSRRIVLQRDEQERRQHLYDSIQAGEIRRGTVRSVTEYGAFVDIGGVDGLLHVTDMSWGRVNKPEDVVKPGDEIEVKVIKVNKEKKKISLSLKQTKPDPWQTVEQKYSPGMKLNGRVLRMENFGAFVELEPGLDGLVPISELSWTRRLRHPSEVLKEGDVIEVSILSVDAAKKRMSLSLKALAQDPWGTAAERYPEGATIQGKVVRTTDFGAFVQLEDGIDGLIHISELSDERVRSVTDKVKPGQQVEVRVLGVDPQLKKISLSMRKPPAEPSPEEIAKIEAARKAEEGKKKRAKPRRGGITVGWDDGGLSLGSLDPSRFTR